MLTVFRIVVGVGALCAAIFIAQDAVRMAARDWEVEPLFVGGVLVLVDLLAASAVLLPLAR